MSEVERLKISCNQKDLAESSLERMPRSLTAVEYSSARISTMSELPTQRRQGFAPLTCA